MAYLQRINYRPNTDNLNDAEKNYLAQHFEAYGAEIVINGQPIAWQLIDTVEVAKAARASGVSGWIVKKLVMGGDRYHVGIYCGRDEAVLINVTLNVAQYILKNIAYYGGQSITYTGPADLVGVTE
ncbi:MAG: hypothetical protein H7Y11_04380 [Armatimonadetes bacterium]|nr:hypothetical protein [Anaerolineae bacterium]